MESEGGKPGKNKEDPAGESPENLVEEQQGQVRYWPARSRHPRLRTAARETDRSGEPGSQQSCDGEKHRGR